MPLLRTCVMCKVPRTSSTGSGEWLLYLDNIYQNTPSPLTREVGSLMIFSEVDARWNCNPFRSCAVAAQSIKYFFASVIRCIAQTAALSWALSRFVPVLCVRCLAPQI